MNALVKKNFHLQMPAFFTSLLLAGALWLLPQDRHTVFSVGMAEGALLFCSMLMLVLGAFGREFTAGTFPMLLSQPLPRALIWWMKTLLLAAMAAVVWGVWYVSWTHHHPLENSANELRTMKLVTLLFTVAMYSGGLWTVLFFRQVAVAFWFTLLAPAAIWMTIENIAMSSSGWLVDTAPVQITAFIVYSVAGFLFAMRLFARAQDVQWTGGQIQMPEVRWLAISGAGMRRRWRPRAALLVKEFQLHQMQFIIAGVLVLLHLGAIAMRNFGNVQRNSSTEAVLHEFWALWVIVPLLIGCAAVAEERKMGTHEGQLCLPAKKRTQFALKCLVVIILSVLFGCGFPLLLEGPRILPEYDFYHVLDYFRYEREASAGYWALFALDIIGWVLNALPVLTLAAISATVAAIALYVSTLSRNMLQALAPAVIGAITTFYLLIIAFRPEPVEFIRIVLWWGPLIYLIGVPIMTAVLVTLAYSNYKQVSPGWNVWWKNLGTLAISLALVISATAAVYHRPWELLAPIEPPHGTARLPTDAARLQTNRRDITVLLPEGRAWITRYDDFSTNPADDGKFLDGTNWAGIALIWNDIAGIQRDGSLWVSERPIQARERIQAHRGGVSNNRGIRLHKNGPDGR